HRDARAGDEAPRRGDAFLQRRQLVLRLERIARSDQPPDAIEPQAPERQPSDEHMAFVGRVERTAEQADAHARRERRQTRNLLHETVCAASSSAWRSAVRASTMSSRPSPSMIRSSEYRVRLMRWSVTRP